MLPALITFSMLGTFMNIKLLTSILQSFNGLIISEDFLTRHRIGNAFICSGKLSFSNLIYFVLQSVHTSIPINYSRFLDDFSSELPPFVSKQAFSKAKQGISHKAFLELFRFSVKQFYFQTADLRTWNSFHIFRINENWRWAKQTKVHKHNPKGVLKRKESFRIFYAESEGIAQSSNLMILRHSLPKYKKCRTHFCIRHNGSTLFLLFLLLHNWKLFHPLFWLRHLQISVKLLFHKLCNHICKWCKVSFYCIAFQCIKIFQTVFLCNRHRRKTICQKLIVHNQPGSSSITIRKWMDPYKLCMGPCCQFNLV